MPLNLDARNRPLGPLVRDYGPDDIILYALGVGAGFSNLEYCYEDRLKVIPTFSVAMIFDLFFEAVKAAELDPEGILHGEQELLFHHPIPVEGTLTAKGRITHFVDKGEGRGALVRVESETRHSNGEKLFTSIMTIFARRDGGFGGSDRLSKEEIRIPDREPDHIEPDHPFSNQPLIYRLSGDRFALHVDPAFARAAGFEQPIMHGLCTMGFACRALIDTLTPGAPEQVRRLKCRFSKPLYPGVPIETRIWKTDSNTALWQTRNAETGDIVINNGICEYR